MTALQSHIIECVQTLYPDAHVQNLPQGTRIITAAMRDEDLSFCIRITNVARAALEISVSEGFGAAFRLVAEMTSPTVIYIRAITGSPDALRVASRAEQVADLLAALQIGDAVLDFRAAFDPDMFEFYCPAFDARQVCAVLELVCHQLHLKHLAQEELLP